MASRFRWPGRILAEARGPGEGPGGGVAGAGGGGDGRVGSRLLMSHLLGGGREQPPAEQFAEQAEELLTCRVRQLVPELLGANRALVPRRRRGGTDRLGCSDMARL